MTPVDVSVILLTYNHESFVAQAIKSVLDQHTSAKVELLISEDRSTDRTRGIVLEHAARYPDRVRTFLSERNLNTSEVIARAHREARGEFVAYLDGDDYWLPNKIDRQLAFLRAHPRTPLCFHSVRLEGEEVEEGAIVGSELEWVSLRDLLLHNHIMAPSIMYRRRLLPTMPAWLDDLPFGDWPITLLLAQHGALGYLDEPLAVYRVHGAGMWSGAGALQQARWEVEFLEGMRPHLPTARPVDLSHAITDARLRLARVIRQTQGRQDGTAAARRVLRDISGDSSLHLLDRGLVLGRVLGPRVRHRLKRLRR